MKNKLFVLVAFIAAYGGFWFYHANKAKVFVSKELQKLEQPDAEGNRLQYDGLKIDGYPFSYKVVIKNPRYGSGTKQEAFLDGFLTIGTNILGTKYWIEKSGNIHFLDNGDPNQHHHLIMSGESTISADIIHPYSLNVTIHPFEEVSEQPINLSIKHLFDEINKLQFEGNNIILKEGEGDNQTLGEVSSISSGVSMKETSDGLDQYFLDLDVKGLEAKDKFIDYFNHFFPSKHADEIKNLLNPNFMFGPKKMDLQFKGSIALPKGYKEGFPNHLLVNIDKFNAVSDFGEKSVKGNLVYKDQNNDTTIHASLDAAGKVSEENDKYIVKAFMSALQSAANDKKNKEDTQIEKLQKLLQCCQADLEKIPPHYHEFGNIRVLWDADLNYNKETVSGEVKIKNFDITSDLYGFQSHGFANGHQIEIKGKYIIDLLDYKTMIEDLNAYYNRIHFLFPIFAESPENAPPLIPRPAVSKFLRFLRNISDSPKEDTKNLTITIDFLEPQSVKIGTLTLPEATVEWSKFQHELGKELIGH